MDRILLNQKCTYSQATSMTRWIAMGIVTAPEEKRGIRYLSARRNMEDAIKRFGIQGDEAEECLLRNMDSIRRLVRELEANGSGDVQAA